MNYLKRLKSHFIRIQSANPKRSQAGMSLIEVMLVLVIIGVIATVIMNSVGGGKDKALRKTTLITMTNLAANIELDYKLVKHSYPNDLQEVVKEHAITKIPKDAWGNEIVYQKKDDGSGFKLISKGKDGKLGTEEDIVEDYPKE